MEFDLIKNLLKILGNSFENEHNGTKECETSCLYILSRYIDALQNNKLLSLYDTVSSMKPQK